MGVQWLERSPHTNGVVGLIPGTGGGAFLESACSPWLFVSLWPCDELAACCRVQLRLHPKTAGMDFCTNVSLDALKR